MSSFIILGNFTQKGIEHIKDAPSRLDAVKQAFRAAGGEIKAFYLVMGQYDFVVVADAPDAKALARVLLTSAAQGNFRSETLRAFPEDEYRSIVASLP